MGQYLNVWILMDKPKASEHNHKLLTWKPSDVERSSI